MSLTINTGAVMTIQWAHVILNSSWLDLQKRKAYPSYILMTSWLFRMSRRSKSLRTSHTDIRHACFQDDPNVLFGMQQWAFLLCYDDRALDAVKDLFWLGQKVL